MDLIVELSLHSVLVDTDIVNVNNICTTRDAYGLGRRVTTK